MFASIDDEVGKFDPVENLLLLGHQAARKGSREYAMYYYHQVMLLAPGTYAWEEASDALLQLERGRDGKTVE